VLRSSGRRRERVWGTMVSMGEESNGVRLTRMERSRGKRRFHHESLVEDRERTLALGADGVVAWGIGIENISGVRGSRRSVSVV